MSARGWIWEPNDYLTKPFTRAELLSALRTRFAKHEATMQQYNAECERTEALQQRVEALQQALESRDHLLDRYEQALQDAVPKLNMATQMVDSLPSGIKQDRCLKILQAVCAQEITLVNKLPSLQAVLAPEGVELLRQFQLVSW